MKKNFDFPAGSPARIVTDRHRPGHIWLRGNSVLTGNREPEIGNRKRETGNSAPTHCNYPSGGDAKLEIDRRMRCLGLIPFRRRRQPGHHVDERLTQISAGSGGISVCTPNPINAFFRRV